MKPRIEVIHTKKLIGQKITTSYANDKTIALWKSFSPRRKEIINAVNSDLYSVDIYNSSRFFDQFNPLNEFEKWAAVEVNSFDRIPEGMEKLIIPEGQYAVFSYKGKPSEAQKTFEYIYQVWLPNSIYEMDNRPYFARMGEKYKGEDPDSEEEFWIPIKIIN